MICATIITINHAVMSSSRGRRRKKGAQTQEESGEKCDSVRSSSVVRRGLGIGLKGDCVPG